MNEFTSQELRAVNNASRIHDPDVYLGDYIQRLVQQINSDFQKGLGIDGTPVNASAAGATLTIGGVVIDGETVDIGNDRYEFAADDAQTVEVGNIPVDITNHVTASSGTLTVAVQPTSGDKMTIGTKVYTFVPVGTDTADGEISIGADLAEAKLNIVASINGLDGISDPHPLVGAAAFNANNCTITALIGGVAGDSIDTIETFGNVGNIFSAAALSGGADCTKANAVTDLVAAITAGDTEGVTATDGAGDTVVLAAASGAAGNSIAVATDMANGSFGAGVVALSGGADQTSPNGARFMVDGTNLYVYVTNTWYKLTLGSL